MLTEPEIRMKIKELEEAIYDELNTPSDDPIRQWTALKAYHAQRIAFQDVLMERGVR